MVREERFHFRRERVIFRVMSSAVLIMMFPIMRSIIVSDAVCHVDLPQLIGFSVGSILLKTFCFVTRV